MVATLDQLVTALRAEGLAVRVVWPDVAANIWTPRPVVENPWTGERFQGVRQIEEHETRGRAGNDPQNEYIATINWIRGGNASCTIVIGPFEVAIMVSPQLAAIWCAGFGGKGRWTWAADFIAYSLEHARGGRFDAWHPRVVENSVKVHMVINRLEGVPLVRIKVRDQAVWPIPAGCCGHADYENGVKLGKTDGDDNFAWGILDEANRRLAVAQPREDELTMDSEARAAFTELKALVQANRTGFRWIKRANHPMVRLIATTIEARTGLTPRPIISRHDLTFSAWATVGPGAEVIDDATWDAIEKDPDIQQGAAFPEVWNRIFG